MTFYKILQPALAPGYALDSMNRAMIQNVAASPEKLQSTKKAHRINLAQWLTHEVTMATTNSVYGPRNPFKDAKVEKAFWRVFRKHLINILLAD